MALAHVGLYMCKHCHTNPTIKCVPCGHTSCEDHHHGADATASVCGTCGVHITEFEDLKGRLSSALPSMEQDRSFLYTDPSNKNSNLKGRNGVPMTPTPAPRNGNDGHASEPPGGRYVIPHKRNDAPVRPESSMSNHTFASQAPPSYTLPNGNYSFAPSELTKHMAQFNPFSGAPAQSHQYFNGNVNYHPSQMLNNNIINGTRNGHASSISASLNGSAHDSAVPNPRAAHLAGLIRSGAADDPKDADYGNPGPSRRGKTPPRFGPVGTAAGQGNGGVYNSPNNKVTNVNGNAAAFIGKMDVPVPPFLHQISLGYDATVEDIFTARPLIEACRIAQPSTAGVVVIKGIPYAVARSEVIAFLGKNAQICSQPVGTPFHAVHVIMDRLTGKSMDVYVEVETPKEAVWLVQQFRRRHQQGRQGKIGDRPVDVELSSQEELMAALFPLAKKTTWHGAMPKIDTRVEYLYENVPSTGFQGFLTSEEMVHMVKHADTPQRSPFAQRVLIRTYECMISTLHKYPWYAVNHVLLEERERLFKATLDSIMSLINMLAKIHNNNRHDPSKPTPNTLKELAVAALVCPGFTEIQKALIVRALVARGFHQFGSDNGLNVRFGGKDAYANEWPFLVLVKQPGLSDQFMEYLASLFRDATAEHKLPRADVQAIRLSGRKPGYFGAIIFDYTGCKTIADAGRVEANKLEALLRTVLPLANSTPGLRNSSYGS